MPGFSTSGWRRAASGRVRPHPASVGRYPNGGVQHPAGAGQASAAAPTAVSIPAGGARDGHNGRVIDELIARMAAMHSSLEADGDQRRYFHATYQRTTI